MPSDETLLAILRRVIMEPAEDTHRLVYADRLDELGEHARAQFVRTQIELALHISGEYGGVRHYHECAIGTRTGELERVERDLLLSTESLAVGGFIRVRSHDYFGELNEHKTANYRRGLVESLKCPATTFLKHADQWRKGPECKKCNGTGGHHKDGHGDNVHCGHCRGTGDAGGLMGADRRPTYPFKWDHIVTYHRGMKRVDCRAEDVWHCPVYNEGHDTESVGHGRPTPWALAVCTCHPDVDSFWIEPNANGGRAYSKPLVPPDVFAAIEGHRSDPDAARSAMAPVAVRWVHSFLTKAPT